MPNHLDIRTVNGTNPNMRYNGATTYNLDTVPYAEPTRRHAQCGHCRHEQGRTAPTR